MALCRIKDKTGIPTYALYRNGHVCPLSSITDDVPIGPELFDRGIDWIASLPQPSEGQWQVAPEKLLPPIPKPEKCFCIGLNYIEHANESGSQIPDQPVVFNKLPSALVGHGESICLPKVSKKVDFEGELVVVIGKPGRHIAVGDVMDHVFGFTCGNDVSARDWQKGVPQQQWLLGKTFDTFGPVGPCLVTKSEVGDLNNLNIRLLLNEQVMQDSNTKHLIFSIPTLIAHISQIVTFQPGDIIFTGTPPGVGAARTPPVFMKAGDVCSVEIEGIGTLTNRCEAEK
jgi:2-keto-4-pentenoate hydratase/2-oxohepta-3-ene-1,7-dioic acid hydratase in catechol pathway